MAFIRSFISDWDVMIQVVAAGVVVVNVSRRGIAHVTRDKLVTTRRRRRQRNLDPQSTVPFKCSMANQFKKRPPQA